MLFARIQKYVREGRWQLVGGMVVQPDCNLPGEVSFRRQFQQAQGFFQSRFGRVARIGYNVDSFGHTAYLPRFFRQAGFEGYVIGRPGPAQVALPANLFRWRSPDGYEIPTFRIPLAYCCTEPDLRPQINAALETMPAAMNHTMCFYGVGDHGGGPTKQQIEWILANPEPLPGVRLVFSHPQAFFDAITPQVKVLPVFDGELQNTFRGCYLSQRPLRSALRKAEALLVQEIGRAHV